MRRKKTLIIIILIVLAGLIWWYLSRRQDAATSAADSSLIYDRVWVDKKPKMSKAYIHALFVMEHLPVGVFQKASAYRLEVERFNYRIDKNVIDLRLPQDERKAKIRYTIRSCKELPPYDLCLTLDKHPMDGPKHFFGLRNPNKGKPPHRAVRERLERTLRRR
jgi:hypothetical protein